MTSNEAVNEPAGEQAVEFQGNPQPRPAMTLVNGHRVVSYENYECFLGVSANVSDLKKFLESRGLTPNKSLSISALNVSDEVFANFLRGELDGDGGWYLGALRLWS